MINELSPPYPPYPTDAVASASVEKYCGASVLKNCTETLWCLTIKRSALGGNFILMYILGGKMFMYHLVGRPRQNQLGTTSVEYFSFHDALGE